MIDVLAGEVEQHRPETAAEAEAVLERALWVDEDRIVDLDSDGYDREDLS